MKRQINCKHYLEEAKKTSVYTYQLVDKLLNLCNKCEKKLRKQVLKQKEIEDWSKKTFKELEKRRRNIK